MASLRGKVVVGHKLTRDEMRKARIRLDLAGARAYLGTVPTPLCQVPASMALYQRGLDLQARWQFSFHDSLSVAAALEAGCTRLLSEDLQDGQWVEGLRIENPRSRFELPA